MSSNSVSYAPHTEQGMNGQTDNSCLMRRRHEDCLSCRLISGFGVVGMGAYLYSHSKRKPPGGYRSTMMVLSAAVAAVGVSRLLNLAPFRPRHESEFSQHQENKFWRRRFTKNAQDADRDPVQ